MITDVQDRIEIQPTGPIHASIRPPGSKSITNRALICAAMADGQSSLTGALDSEDTRVMLDALRQLGIEMDEDLSNSSVKVNGCGGRIPNNSADLFVANSGTTIRFLTAMLAACQGNFRLDGIQRMRERPIGDLLDALNQLGSSAAAELENNCPPVRIESNRLSGGRVKIQGSISSQFLSGLLMAAPYATGDVEIEVEGELVSQPYVRMTLAVMRSFGVDVDDADLARLLVPGNRQYDPCDYSIEPDASAASYFWAAAAITGGRVTVEGLTKQALQGDVAFCDCLEQMGCEIEEGDNGLTVTGRQLRGINVNMNAISDTVQTLAAVALFADCPTTITDVAHIRHKETDRIGDLACELRKLGAQVEERADGLCIIPRSLRGAEIETYNDHRMAMSLSLVGLRTRGVVILNPACTAKTYPRFFDDLAAIR